MKSVIQKQVHQFILSYGLYKFIDPNTGEIIPFPQTTVYRQDFDVNGFVYHNFDPENWSMDQLSYNPAFQIDIRKVIENITRKEFYVFSADGRLYYGNEHAESSTSLCIGIYSLSEKKLGQRIQNMQARGWACKNSNCSREWCLLYSKNWRSCSSF
jgi:Family of unknown function (DUF5769)